MSEPVVVVGYDDSDGGRAALDRGVAEVQAAGGTLVVVAVVAMPFDAQEPFGLATFGDGAPPIVPIVEPPATQALLEAARRKVDAAGIAAEYVWETGEPADAIVREAHRREASAVVVGKGHHSRLGRWLGTDIAAEVERAAGCRVLVVDA